MLSKNLEHTLHKALAVANQYHHEYATLEHLLHALTDDQDAIHWRAAELLFRPQRVTRHEGRVLLGDRETLDLGRDTQGFGELGRLLSHLGEHEASNENFQAGLALISQRLPDLPMPAHA